MLEDVRFLRALFPVEGLAGSGVNVDGQVRRRVASRAVWLMCTCVAEGEALRIATEDPDALVDRRIPLVQVETSQDQDCVIGLGF